jgi:hypothetical protein
LDIDNSSGLVDGILDEIIAKDPNFDDIKNEIWEDLSNISYKYEYDRQKVAFREVMVEISQKIERGKWSNVYQKLYRLKQR